MPIGFRIIQKLNIIDKPNQRKIHKKEVLSGGGIFVFTGILISFIFMVYNYQSIELEESMFNRFYPFILGLSILFLMGLLDDRFILNAKTKFLLQIISCIVFIVLSNQFISFEFIFNNKVLSCFLTIFFMLSVINAFNLIDGLDGLSSGLSLISLISLSLILSFEFNYMVYVLIGAILVFLIKNSYPAKIFLGDAGSYTLGYSISVFVVIVINNSEISGTLNISYMLLFIAIPVIDVVFAFSRRIINRVNIFSPDKKHLHHRLLNRGLSHPNVVFVLYFIHALFALLGLIALGVQLSNTLFLLSVPFAYFISLIFKAKKSKFFYFLDNIERLKEIFNHSIIFLLIPCILYFNICLILNDAIFDSYPLILTMILIPIIISVFHKDNNVNIVFIFYGLILSIASYQPFFEDSWINMFGTYLNYFIMILLLFFIFINAKKMTFHPSLFLFFISLILFSSTYRLELSHVINFIIILGSYKILLNDPIISNYKLLHAVSILTLLIALCI